MLQLSKPAPGKADPKPTFAELTTVNKILQRAGPSLSAPFLLHTPPPSSHCGRAEVCVCAREESRLPRLFGAVLISSLSGRGKKDFLSKWLMSVPS